MKKSGVIFSVVAAMGMLVNSGLAWSGDIDPISGMITGALVGSVFGPDKKHRAQNALIGAVSGAFIGSQLLHADNRSFYGGGYRPDWDGRWGHHSRHRHRDHRPTVIERGPAQRTVFITPRNHSKTVIVDRHGRTKYIIIDP